MKHTVVPGWVRRMSRGWRLALFTIAMMVTVAVVIPGYIVSTGYLVGFGACDRPDTAATSSICSPLGRLFFTGLGIAILVPLARNWARFLARVLALTDGNSPLQSYAAERIAQSPNKASSITLRFRQRLISGTIELENRSNHCLVVEGKALTFWSLHALRKGWLKAGDRLVVVYQEIPFVSSLKLALAFWKSPDSLVRGVAAGMQSASVLIATLCMATLVALKPPFAELLIVLCTLLIAVNFIYLTLMLRARRVLRDFIDHEATT